MIFSKGYQQTPLGKAVLVVQIGHSGSGKPHSSGERKKRKEEKEMPKASSLSRICNCLAQYGTEIVISAYIGSWQ